MIKTLNKCDLKTIQFMLDKQIQRIDVNVKNDKRYWFYVKLYKKIDNILEKIDK